ncbi:MAG TPA: DEAD/DEAH box helicase [Acetobacteraceae bacterium]|nr:DEAD/DEAH box helicase [Acetobacteraceae bacterium]
MSSFAELGLAAPLLKALEAEGYATPTPIQSQSIPHALQGRDVQGIAQTGTGKTAAFALPILHRLMADRRPPLRRGCRVLVLSPTRELASQIAESFRAYGRFTGLRTALMFGGVPKPRQAKAVANGVDILVATPGRLLDHMNDGAITVAGVEILVLDEADHMLDLGFIVPIRRIVSGISAKRQTLFFSATMPKEIAQLAGSMLRDPVHVAVTPVATTAERVQQKVIFVEAARKRQMLADILRDKRMERTLVFTRTKHGADKVTHHLEAVGQTAAAIHGNKSQPQRERALAAFKEGRVRVLVATDIAARGIEKLIRTRLPVEEPERLAA